ncbi:MAG TPA: flagellar basal-body MS-ring/collar protein FliF [Kofleriaceae bacterium]
MAEPPLTGAAAVLSQSRALWGRQSRGRKLGAIAAVLGIAGVIAATTLIPKTEPWTSISENASPEDVNELYSVLQGRQLPVRLKDGKLEVATGRADEARAIAAGAGLPHAGKGLEIFDGASLGQSSFAEQVNYRRALQGELARSITAMAQVQSARVLIAFGKRSLTRDQEQPASASVAIHLHPGQSLTADQVRGVRQLVAASVEGLKAEAVAIVDNRGNLLDAKDATDVDRKAEIERGVTARVRAMLERVVGPGKVSVVTTADVDDRKVSETQELFDAEHPALRSEARTLDGPGAVDQAGNGMGGIAGTRGNLPGAPGGSATGSAAGSASGAPSRLQETKNYEVSRTVRQTTKPDVLLQKLHVAVVVDYKDENGKPVARSDKELAELTAIARQSAGIDDARGDKIEVRAVPFAADPDAIAAAPAAPPASVLPLPLPILIGAGAGALVLAFVIFVLIKRKKQIDPAPMLALPAPVGELERVLEARTGLPRAQTENGLALDGGPVEGQHLLPARDVRERVIDIVKSDVERAAGVLTAWLSEPPKKGAK